MPVINVHASILKSRCQFTFFCCPGSSQTTEKWLSVSLLIQLFLERIELSITVNKFIKIVTESLIPFLCSYTPMTLQKTRTGLKPPVRVPWCQEELQLITVVSICLKLDILWCTIYLWCTVYLWINTSMVYYLTVFIPKDSYRGHLDLCYLAAWIYPSIVCNWALWIIWMSSKLQLEYVFPDRKDTDVSVGEKN